MKSLFSVLILLVLLSSCTKDYQPRNIDTISIKEFKIDNNSIRSIVAIDSLTMYYAGGNGDIGYTNNGAESWEIKQFIHQDSITPNFRSIAFNSNTNFVYALSISNPALLYQYNFSDTFIVYKEEHEKVFYDSMKFFDELNGIAMGDPTEGNCLSILITKDGGNTWSKSPCNQLPEVAEGEAAFAASNTNIKVLDSTVWIVSGGKKSRVFKSTNFGNTWEVFETPIIQGNGPQGIYSIDFADENNGIVIGGDYSKPKENSKNKAITADGGKTWTIVADGQDPNYKSCVQYVPDTNGKEVFAVGKTGISYSNDGGFTWKEVSKEGYYTIQFVNRNFAWLSGNEKIGKLTLP